MVSLSSFPDRLSCKNIVNKVKAAKYFRKNSCRSAISIKLPCNFTEITLWHVYSPVNLLHIFRTLFLWEHPWMAASEMYLNIKAGICKKFQNSRTVNSDSFNWKNFQLKTNWWSSCLNLETFRMQFLVNHQIKPHKQINKQTLKLWYLLCTFLNILCIENFLAYFQILNKYARIGDKKYCKDSVWNRIIILVSFLVLKRVSSSNFKPFIKDFVFHLIFGRKADFTYQLIVGNLF